MIHNQSPSASPRNTTRSVGDATDHRPVERWPVWMRAAAGPAKHSGPGSGSSSPANPAPRPHPGCSDTMMTSVGPSLSPRPENPTATAGTDPRGVSAQRRPVTNQEAGMGSGNQIGTWLRPVSRVASLGSNGTAGRSPGTSPCCGHRNSCWRSVGGSTADAQRGHVRSATVTSETQCQASADRPRRPGSDETHEGCPRNTLGAARRSARETVTVGHGKRVLDGVSGGDHDEGREGLCDGLEEGQGADPGPGRGGDRVVAGQRPAEARGGGEAAAGLGQAGREADREAAGRQVLLRRQEGPAEGLRRLGRAVREVPRRLDAHPARRAGAPRRAGARPGPLQRPGQGGAAGHQRRIDRPVPGAGEGEGPGASSRPPSPRSCCPARSRSSPASGRCPQAGDEVEAEPGSSRATPWRTTDPR
jgi:hypothetical protein